MFDMRMTDFSNENYEKFSHKVVQTDLQRLTSLLNSFGVPYKTNSEGKYGTPAGFTSVKVGSWSNDQEGEPVGGYPGFYTLYQFDSNGEFITMGAWE